MTATPTAHKANGADEYPAPVQLAEGIWRVTVPSR